MAKTRDELARELDLGLLRETAGYGKAKSQIQGFMDADTAPLVEAPQVPGADVSFLGALGAALRGGQAVDDLLARQSAAEDREAQMNLTAGLANQQQKGYLGMRQQEREGLMSGLDKEIIKAQARINDMKLGMDLGPIEAEEAFKRQKELLKLQGEMDAKNNEVETPGDRFFREMYQGEVDDYLLAIEKLKGPELVAKFGPNWGIVKPERADELRDLMAAAVKGRLRGLSPQLKLDYVEALQDALRLHPIEAPEPKKRGSLDLGKVPGAIGDALNFMRDPGGTLFRNRERIGEEIKKTAMSTAPFSYSPTGGIPAYRGELPTPDEIDATIEFLDGTSVPELPGTDEIVPPSDIMEALNQSARTRK